MRIAAKGPFAVGQMTALLPCNAAWAASVAVLALVTSAAGAPAQSDTATNNLDLIPEDQSLWHESLLWDKDIVLRAGFGYKDNVLLTPSARQGSAFLTSGLDLTIYRLPLDGLEANFSVVGDDIRYLRRPGGLSGEDLFLTSATVQKYFKGVWRAGLELRYSYIDQVLEEFLQTGGAQAFEAKGNILGLRPFIRRDLSSQWWVQLEAPLAHEWWQSPLDSSWKYGGQALVGFSYGPHSQVTLTGGGFYVPHDRWLARDSQGTELPGRRLALWKQVAELKWEHQWDMSNHWATVTKLGFNHSLDNGGGYFDYYRYFIWQEIRFRTKDWEAKAYATLSYFDFPVQAIDAPPAPTLHLTALDVTLRVERRIYKSIHCFTAFEFEQTTSNDPTSEYTARVVSGGLSWEF